MPLVEATQLLAAEKRRQPPPLIAAHDERLDREQLVRLAERVQAEVSPLVALEPLDAAPWAGRPLHQPDALLCELTGVSHLFGGETGLLRAAESVLRREYLRGRFAIADTAGAAWALAHHPPPQTGAGPLSGCDSPHGDCPDDDSRHGGVIAGVGETLRWLDPLPVESLRLDLPTVATLRRLGVETVGAVRRLPRDGLAMRLGDGLVKRLAQATGELEEPLTFHHSPPEHTVSLELEYATDDLAILNDRIRQLVQSLCKRLAENRRGALQVQCCLVFADQPACELELGLFAPTADDGHLGRLLATALEARKLPEPVVRLTVKIPLTSPLRQVQTSLFEASGEPGGGGGGAGQSLTTARLIDSLSGRLGREAVRGVQLRKDPLPEHAFESFPLTGNASPRNRRVAARPQKPAFGPSPEDALRRPLTLLPDPLPLRALHERPSAAARRAEQNGASSTCCPSGFRLSGKIHRVLRHWGPERIETGWWNGPTVRRDYFRIETDRGECWWIFQNLAPHDRAHQADRPPEWMLHGRFA